jgi:hypothetical protein
MNIKAGLAKLDELENIRKCVGHVRLEWMREILLAMKEPEDDKKIKIGGYQELALRITNANTRIGELENKFGSKNPKKELGIAIKQLSDRLARLEEGRQNQGRINDELYVSVDRLNNHTGCSQPVAEHSCSAQSCDTCHDMHDSVPCEKPEPSTYKTCDAYCQTCRTAYVAADGHKCVTDRYGDMGIKCEKHGQTNCIACYEPSSVSECRIAEKEAKELADRNFARINEPKPTTTPESKEWLIRKIGSIIFKYCDPKGIDARDCQEIIDIVRDNTPKPSVEKCDTITISRKVAEEWLSTQKVSWLDTDEPLMDAIKLALSKEAK